MTYTPEQAIAAARHQSENGPEFGVGLCLQRCRICFGVDSKYPDAAAAWAGAQYKHTRGVPPRGTLVFWTGGSHGHGHIAISAGDGCCWSTDIKRLGRFDKVSIDLIHEQWGMTYAGFTEDINGVRVIKLPRNTRWRRVRKALKAALTTDEAKGVKRAPLRKVIADALAAVKNTPID